LELIQCRVGVTFGVFRLGCYGWDVTVGVTVGLWLGCYGWGYGWGVTVSSVIGAVPNIM